MAKEESEKIVNDIYKIEENIHFYKKELSGQWSEKGVYNVHKALTSAKEEERRLNFKLHKTERKENDIKKRKRDIDSFTHTD